MLKKRKMIDIILLIIKISVFNFIKNIIKFISILTKEDLLRIKEKRTYLLLKK